ncbi:type VI secretion system tip protein VgrG [Reichenbachiella sp.]|uniref:type VI secretion system tip protein VgrG n=1 Tax=Reichenbachiella sp. TaxID=2184521 RepID=UPI003BB1B802
MAASADIATGGVATYTIKVAGNSIPDVIAIYAIEIEMAVNKISTARIIVLDGDAATGNFEVSSGDTFVPGKEVIIEAGYDNKSDVIFKGVITRQSIQVDDESGPTLEIECRDQAIKMAVGRKCLTFSKKKDSDIITTILGNYSDVENDVAATTYEWPEQVQYYVSDWDYVISRAEANGLIVTDINNKVSVVKPDSSTTSVLKIEYGDNLIECKADLNSVSQLGSAKASAWDFKTQAIVSEQSSNDHPGGGNITSKKLSQVVGLSDYEVQSTAPFESACLTDWAKAQLVKSEYAKIQGELTIAGTKLPLPGTYITLAGMGSRLNGDHIVAGIIHDISDGDWTSEVSIGLSDDWFTENPDVMSPSASGLLPGASGLFNGTVKKMHEDPDSQYRILVDIPMFDKSGEGIWARLSNFYSTNGAGVFFMPEVGDEVVLGFLNEDPRFPIILGSLYSSSKLKPADDYSAEEKNPKKAIVSKSGITVEFDDENKVFTITTPAKNTVVLSDKDKQVSLKDQNDNSIVMSNDGITIKSSKAITIQSEKNVAIKGDQGIKVESSSGDVETTGTNIKETANSQYTAKGSASAEVQGGGELTLKGAMVKIN